MKVLFIGAKGVPAVFGGVEFHVDELSRGVVRAGEEAAVYVRNWYTAPGIVCHQGVRLVRLPTIRTKHLDATVHSFLASVHGLFSGADIIHYHGIGPAFFSFLPRLAGRRVAVTVHRLDWAADKWSAPAGALLRLAERVAVRAAHRVIAVSADIGRYLRRRYGVDPAVIPNGLSPVRYRALEVMASRLGLEAGKYVLFLGRLVPEKRPDWLVRAFREGVEAAAGLKLVLAGGASGTESYVRKLREAAEGDSRIVFPGNVQGRDKEELFGNALLFVLPSRVEGHPIALLEARSYGLACLASDIGPHREIVEDGRDGLLFRSADYGDLAAKLQAALRDPQRLRELGRRAREDAARQPDWGAVTAATLAVYRSLGASRRA